jgi:hypothetical protein
MIIMNIIFWDMMPGRLVEVYPPSSGLKCKLRSKETSNKHNVHFPFFSFLTTCGRKNLLIA